MLAELAIDDLVLIAEARLAFAPGLNVITGETGAGKSLLAQAIGLLMGQKGGDELVRPGADRALAFVVCASVLWAYRRELRLLRPRSAEADVGSL